MTTNDANQQAALTSFAAESSLYRGPPIPLDQLRKDGLALSLEFERTTDVAMEWTGLLDQAGSLSVSANGGELDDPDEPPAPKKKNAKTKKGRRQRP